MARPRKNGICKRVQLRIPEDLESVFDNYSSDQLSEVMAIALRTISPDSPLGLSLPTLVRPIEPITKTVVRLQIQSRCIRLVFPEKRDDFRGVVVSLGYEWSQWCWQKNISQTADLCDRAAEVTHLLLLKGFCVQVEHTEIRDRAIAASYTLAPSSTSAWRLGTANSGVPKNTIRITPVGRAPAERSW